MQDVRKLINSLIIKTELTEKLDIDTEKLYTYAYICIDQESWNDNKNFEGIKNEFEKFANVLPSNYNVRGEKIKTYDIARFKYAKIGLTKTSTTLLTSGTEIYNYTKLPYEFENQYFYTYIIELYKNIYLKKIAVEYKKNKTQETRKKFINFSKNIWIQEITSQNEGNNFAKNWKKVLELETEYKEVKNNDIIIPDTAIRLRVIPNSNSTLDQNIKNKVKKYLENNTYNLIKDEDSKEIAKEKIKNNIPLIEENVKQIFSENNYDMNFDINYGLNYFPEKEYRGLKYNEGYYESVVISIGKAEGDNWWCVLFPNLCLVDLETKDNVEYKSWIVEKINKIF